MGQRYYIGLMSGTSMDAVDAVAVSFDQDKPSIKGQYELPLPDSVKQRLLDLCSPGQNEIDLMGSLDIEVAELFADAVSQLLAKYSITSDQVVAIGSHGQTIRHRPPNSDLVSARPFTLQIGDPNTICHQTGITTVADFRRRDMAAGGQGAPLVPAFHLAAFGQKNRDVAVVNIGGIANVTLLPSDPTQLTGFDTGPGNALMDAWIERHLNQPIDFDGAWAASGRVNTPLLNALLAHPFFSAQAPKSTGREDFNIDWLDAALADLPPISAVDVQATLLEVTARSIVDTLKIAMPTCENLYVCGGGAFNKALLHRLSVLFSGDVSTTASIGICPKQVEACAFAWMAKQVIEGRKAGMSSVTGATQNTLLGGIYLGDNHRLFSDAHGSFAETQPKQLQSQAE